MKRLRFLVMMFTSLKVVNRKTHASFDKTQRTKGVFPRKGQKMRQWQSKRLRMKPGIANNISEPEQTKNKAC